jgi:anti-sigma factor RsiW
MRSSSFHDMEILSAYLDGQLSSSDRTRLEKRIHTDENLAEALKALRHTRTLLLQTPHRRAPRNFTLTPKMAGIRAPVPRLVPVFSWASAVALLLFIFTLGTSLIGQIASGTAAPMLAAAPSGLGGGPAAAATMAPALSAPATAAPAVPAHLVPAPATAAPMPLNATDQSIQATATPEAYIMSVPEATPPGVMRVIPPQAAAKVRPKPLNPWLIIWPGLGLLLGAVALLLSWLNQRAFQRKNPRK